MFEGSTLRAGGGFIAAGRVIFTGIFIVNYGRAVIFTCVGT